MGRMQTLKAGRHPVARLLQIICLCLLFAPPAHAEESQDYVTEILPYPIEKVYDRALTLFNSERRDYYEDYNAKIYDLPEPVANYKDLSPEAYRRFMAFPLVRPNKFYVFYGAYATMQHIITDLTPLAAMGHNNAALQRYAALPLAAREQDFYLWSPDTPFWHSGYKHPFRAYFIVHLEAVDDTHTRVEVIENEPVMRLPGASVDIYGKLLPYTLEEVEPTTTDREFLISCIRQFIERNVAGRHWFNCRMKDEKVEPIVPFTVP